MVVLSEAAVTLAQHWITIATLHAYHCISRVFHKASSQSLLVDEQFNPFLIGNVFSIVQEHVTSKDHRCVTVCVCGQDRRVFDHCVLRREDRDRGRAAS